MGLEGGEESRESQAGGQGGAWPLAPHSGVPVGKDSLRAGSSDTSVWKAGWLASRLPGILWWPPLQNPPCSAFWGVPHTAQSWHVGTAQRGDFLTPGGEKVDGKRKNIPRASREGQHLEKRSRTPALSPASPPQPSPPQLLGGHGPPARVHPLLQLRHRALALGDLLGVGAGGEAPAVGHALPIGWGVRGAAGAAGR